MAKRFQFDDFEGSGKAPQCTACEGMLADALDGSLDEVDQTWFDRHIATCAGCSGMLADAQRGAAWLEMLKTPRPEPSARLMERILAQTSGAEAGGLRGETEQRPQMVPGRSTSVMPLGVPGDVLPFRPRAVRMPAWAQVRSRGGMFEPRLAMTAAMAFFSIALTLNLTGVQLNRLHLSDLSPTNLKRTYYSANAGAARYYDNLRVVRVLESRVDDLREAAADRAQPAKEAPKEQQPTTTPESPGNKPEEKKKPPVEPGMSRRATPMGRPESLRAEEGVLPAAEPNGRMSKLQQAGGLG